MDKENLAPKIGRSTEPHYLKKKIRGWIQKLKQIGGLLKTAGQRTPPPLSLENQIDSKKVNSFTNELIDYKSIIKLRTRLAVVLAVSTTVWSYWVFLTQFPQ